MKIVENVVRLIRDSHRIDWEDHTNPITVADLGKVGEILIKHGHNPNELVKSLEIHT